MISRAMGKSTARCISNSGAKIWKIVVNRKVTQVTNVQVNLFRVGKVKVESVFGQIKVNQNLDCFTTYNFVSLRLAHQVKSIENCIDNDDDNSNSVVAVVETEW